MLTLSPRESVEDSFALFFYSAHYFYCEMTMKMSSECVEMMRDIEWAEEGLEGTIPDVPVLVDPETDEVLYFPANASEVIGAWRRREIKRRGLHEKQAQLDRLKAESQRLREGLDALDRLGFCKSYGIDEDKMRRHGLFTSEGHIHWEKVYEMDRNTSSSSSSGGEG